MKHLITTNTGGFPFDLDDYRFMEDGFNEDIVAILKAYKYRPQASVLGTAPPHSLIVYGCEMSTAPIDIGGTIYQGAVWTEGAVMINGIIYKVNAKTVPDGVPNMFYAYYFDTGVEYDPLGDENFRDGSLHSTYGIRVATPTLQAVGTNKLVFGANSPRFLENIWSGEKDFTYVGDPGAPAYNSPWTYPFITTPRLGFRKNHCNEVELRGICERGAGNVQFGQRIFTLPVGYRPNLGVGTFSEQQSIHFTVMNRNTPQDMYTVFVQGNGGVYAGFSDNFPNSVMFELSAIRFSTV